MGSEQHANNKNYKDLQPSTILNVKCASTLYSKALWTQPLLALNPIKTFLSIDSSLKNVNRTPYLEGNTQMSHLLCKTQL